MSNGIPRSVEMVLALGGLVVSSPLLFLAALLIRATSPGPVLFRQQRVGRFGKPFELLKFRSMRVENEGAQVTAKGDTRVTRVGRLLRKSKLDELPELWNVARGELSLVGPRLEVTKYVNLEDPLWRKVLEARPGITDPVTLRLRNEEEPLAAVERVIRGSGWFGEVMDINQLTGAVIGAAIEVHKVLGPGLLESAYEECPCRELSLRNIDFKRQKPIPVIYKGISLDCGYRMDIVVEDRLVLELKSCEKIENIHRAQLLTYLKLSSLKLGLILNFNTPVMKEGIVRLVNNLQE